MSSTQKIKNIEKYRSRIVQEILNTDAMLSGSFKMIYRKCGKKTCWCFEKSKGHPFYRIVWNQDGKVKTKSIPKKDIDWVIDLTKRYKEFKKKHKKIITLNEKLKYLINTFAKEIIKKSRSQKKYF